MEDSQRHSTFALDGQFTFSLGRSIRNGRKGAGEEPISAVADEIGFIENAPRPKCGPVNFPGKRKTVILT